jgi:ribosomal protein L11 methyltransferase
METTKGQWLEVIIESHPSLTDSITYFLNSLLKRGIRIEENSKMDNCCDRIWAYLSQDDLKKTNLKKIKDYFSRLHDLNPGLSKIKVYEKIIQDMDWSKNWKKYFKPLAIGSFIIKPTWEKSFHAPKGFIIEMDPGQAFGTGAHASTSMVMEAMEKIFEEMDFKKPSVIDVGTGTGILAMAAKKLGASQVLAIDVDETALKTAKENMALNDLEGAILLSNQPLSFITEKFDLVLANIERATLIELSGDLMEKMKTDGCLIISGIIRGQEKDVLKAFSRLKEVFSLQKEDGGLLWTCMVLKHE